MKDREFTTVDKDGKEVSVVFKHPTQSQIMKGDFTYRKYFSEAIREGLMTNAEATKLLKDRQIWSQEMDNKEIALRKEINDIENEFRESSITKDDGLVKRIKLKGLRNELDELTSVYSSISNNTAESVASEYRMQFYASDCSYFKDGMRKIFKDINDFRSRLDEAISLDCYRHAVVVNYELALGRALPDGLNADYPEDSWFLENAINKPDDKQPEAKRRGRKPKIS